MAVLVVGGTGAFIGLFLGVAAIKFKVDVDEKEVTVIPDVSVNCRFRNRRGNSFFNNLQLFLTEAQSEPFDAIQRL